MRDQFHSSINEHTSFEFYKAQKDALNHWLTIKAFHVFKALLSSNRDLDATVFLPLWGSSWAFPVYFEHGGADARARYPKHEIVLINVHWWFNRRHTWISLVDDLIVRIIRPGNRIHYGIAFRDS